MYYWGDHGNNIVPQKGHFPLLKNKFLQNVKREISNNPIVKSDIHRTFAW